jgi:hypothetical protein
MNVFRIFLGTFLLAISTYSAVIVAQYGFNLFSPFFGAICQIAARLTPPMTAPTVEKILHHSAKISTRENLLHLTRYSKTSF